MQVLSLLCAGVVNNLLSFRALFPLSRLTYCAYLLHPLIMVVTAFSLDGPLHIHNMMVVSFDITCAVWSITLPHQIKIYNKHKTHYGSQKHLLLHLCYMFWPSLPFSWITFNTTKTSSRLLHILITI